MQQPNWQKLKPLIQAALEHDPEKHTIEDIEQAIEEGRALLLEGENSAMVCEIVETRSLHVFLAGGNLTELRSGDEQLGSLAQALGCSQVTIMGRMGWARALRDLGYRMLLAKDA